MTVADVAPRGRWYLEPIPVSTVERWEGSVQTVGVDSFIAEIVRISDDMRAVVTLDIGHVTDDDRELCRPGALFYWDVTDTDIRVRFREAESE